MEKHKLIDIASVIRSKNSGPYELTFDVIFKDFETYGKVKAANAINIITKQTFIGEFNLQMQSNSNLLILN